MLDKRLGKPWSSLKPVYLHNLSPVKGCLQRKDTWIQKTHQTEHTAGIKHSERCWQNYWINLSESRICQFAESEQLHWDFLAAPSTVRKSGWECCSQSWTLSTHTAHWKSMSYAKDLQGQNVGEKISLEASSCFVKQNTEQSIYKGICIRASESLYPT